ncbi:hypothetical protein [Clostridium sp.]|uniref:hypothetical protein n=1 Tax=Clostridium sp. TaxID=1506 RepID=UPI00290E6CF5|nr:hypothetical protein [Clostridium sp.]MDU3349083.1 hypothetical protein [Clostridium sp.]MDU3406668.1 hypothetical protein [Clostridium sp.]
MSYGEFIIKYPWADLILELFKGIMPTAVALLAIYINNKRTDKRENLKKYEQHKLKDMYLLDDHIMKLYEMIYLMVKELSNYMRKYKDRTHSKEDFDNIIRKNYELVLFMKKIEMIEEVINRKNGSDRLVFTKSSKSIYELINFIDEFQEKLKYFNDNIGEYLFKLVDKSEDEIIEYLGILNNEIEGIVLKIKV